MTVAYLSLGSNLGHKLEELQAAVDLLGKNEKVNVQKSSDVYQTAPVGGVKQDDFYNIALKIETSMNADELLDLVHSIEQQMHRVRKVHWGPRTLDIDIIWFGDLNIHTENLIIPHPEMNNRKFVLIPLMEIYDGDHKPLTEAINNISGQDIESIGSLIQL